MERVADKARQPDALAGPGGSLLVQAMSHVPGWGEKNFQVCSALLTAACMHACSMATGGMRPLAALLMCELSQDHRMDTVAGQGGRRGVRCLGFKRALQHTVLMCWEACLL